MTRSANRSSRRGCRAEDFVLRRGQAAAEQARRDAARTAAQEQRERVGQAQVAADAARQAMLCGDCGREATGGRAVRGMRSPARDRDPDPADKVAPEAAAEEARTGIESAIAGVLTYFRAAGVRVLVEAGEGPAVSGSHAPLMVREATCP